MSELTTLARPYARAVFELAQAAGSLDAWSDELAFMAAVANDPQLKALMDSPKLTSEQRADIFNQVCVDKTSDAGKNLVKLMAENGRMAALTDVAALFEVMKNEAQGQVDARVVSAQPVSDEQQAAIAKALKERLGREVRLNVSVDESLMGGAVVYAGDLVIDGSIRGRIDKIAISMNR